MDTGSLPRLRTEKFQGCHRRHGFEIPVVGQQEQFIFNRNPGNQTIHRASNGDPFFAASKIYLSGFCISIDGVPADGKSAENLDTFSDRHTPSLI